MAQAPKSTPSFAWTDAFYVMLWVVCTVHFQRKGAVAFAKFQMASVTLKNQWELSETHSNPVSEHTVSNVVQSGKPAWGGKALSTPGEVQTEPRHLTGCTRGDWWACQAARPGPLGAFLSLS